MKLFQRLAQMCTMQQLRDDAFNNISLNGLREIHSASGKPRQKFWIIIFILCNLATSFYLFRVIYECITQSYVAKVAYEETDTYEMPRISFCASRWFNLSAMQQRGLSMDAIMYGLMLYHKKFDVQNVTAARTELVNFLRKNNYTSLTDFFVATSVYLDRNTMNMSTPSRDDSVKIFEPDTMEITRDVAYNLCIYTSLGPVQKAEVKAYGEFAGRVLDLRIQDATNGLISDDLMYLTLRNPHSIERQDSDHYVYFVTGRKYHLVIVPKYFNLRNGDCINTDNPSYKNYNKIECLNKCWQVYISKHRSQFENISLFHLTVQDERDSGVERLEYYTYTNHPEVGENILLYNNASLNCETQCKIECEVETYEISLSSSTLGYEANLRKLSIQFRMQVENGILSIRDIDTYSFDTLIANLGGVLGLYLGGNLFTLVQICVYIWDCCLLNHKGETTVARKWTKSEEAKEPSSKDTVFKNKSKSILTNDTNPAIDLPSVTQLQAQLLQLSMRVEAMEKCFRAIPMMKSNGTLV